MTYEQEFQLEQYLSKGQKVLWIGGDNPNFITHIASRKDEDDMKVGYVSGGKPGDYIVLWNVDPSEIVVGNRLSEIN